MAKHKRSRTPPQYVQRQKQRRRKNPMGMRLRSSHRGEWCAPVTTEVGTRNVCVVGARYGFSAWLTGKDGKRFAPLSVPMSARTPKDALRKAADAVGRVEGLRTRLGPAVRVK